MEQIRRPASGDESLVALASVRAAKNVFLAVILAAIGAQLLCFAAVRWVGVIDFSKEVQAELHRKQPARAQRKPTATAPKAAPTGQPADGAVAPRDASPGTGDDAATGTSSVQTQPRGRSSAPAPTVAHAAGRPAQATAEAASQPDVLEVTEKSELWYAALNWLLPATKFTGLAAALLLSLSLLLAVNLSLVGRTGGAGSFVSAFFWSLAAVICLIPWQHILVATAASGALYNLGDLASQTHKVTWKAVVRPTLLQEALYYVRFAGYPIVLLVVLLVVQAKFARGYRRMTLSVTQSDAAKIGEPEKL